MAEAFISRGGAPLDANGKTPLLQLPAHAASATTYGAGTGSNYGHVKLSDSTSTTSGVSAGVAATPTAVKSAYDLANTANSTATTANTTANAAMPKSGGTFTGAVVAANDTAYTTYKVRNMAIVSATPSSMTNGTIAFVYS